MSFVQELGKTKIMRESVDKYDVSEVLTKLGRLQEGGDGWWLGVVTVACWCWYR